MGIGVKPNAGDLLYVLTQLSEATVEITAESQDITDKNGTLVYRKYTGKTGEITATNAFINLAIVERLSGKDANIASASNPIVMPMFKTVRAGETLDITDYIPGTVKVNALSASGNMGDAYTLGSSASATEFAIASTGGSAPVYSIVTTPVASDLGNYYELSGGVYSLTTDTTIDTTKTYYEITTPAAPGTQSILTPPTDVNEVQYVVAFKKNVTSGVKLVNSSKSFPTAHSLYFKALAVDPCMIDELRPCIVEIPSFMPSPELSLQMQGGDSQTISYNGSIMTNYCSADQELFSVYFIDEKEDVE